MQDRPADNYPPTQKTYEYFAFISYSRKDVQWAKWLQKELEKYRLPMALCKEITSLPKNLRPIFLDMTDLSAGYLQDELHQQLDASKKLIVICSPQSAKSEWVDNEVRHFVNKRSIQDVIPFVVQGKPGGGDMECFPESLQMPETEQLLGISVEELGRRDALLRVMSGLLNVKFDSLRRRHEQRRKRQNLIIAAVVSLFLLLSGVAGYKAYDYYIPHESYFTDYVLRQGVPEGLGPLKKQELSVRSEHYVFVSERGRIISLIHANSAGKPIPHSNTERLNRPMIAKYSYDYEGNVRTVEYTDKYGMVFLAENYTPDLKAIDFLNSKDDSTFSVLAASTVSMNAGMIGINKIYSDFEHNKKSDIARHVLKYDENGFVTKIIYARDNRNTPILDADGIGGLEYVPDAFGRPLEMRYLGLGGEGYVSTSHNVAGKRYGYDDAFNLVRSEYINLDGEPVQNERGWMICKSEYNTRGNLIKESCFDENGNLLVMDIGCAGYEFEYDDRGNIIKESFFGADGRPAMNIYGFASTKNEYDEYGNITESAVFDTDGRPVIAVNGFFLLNLEYDESGNVTKESYFDTDSRPIISNYGYYSVEIEYDKHGNRTYVATFDVDGRPLSNSDGYFSERTEYDERGNMTKLSCFGEDGLPVLTVDGYAGFEWKYDERGNVTAISFFGTDGQPVFSDAYGCAMLKMAYDSQGNLSRTQFFDVDGLPLLTDSGWSGFEWDYDNVGNITGESYFGKDGQPVLSIFGYHYLLMEYDEFGNMVKESYFGTDGQPVLSVEGYAGIEWEYDDFGDVINENPFVID